MRIDDLKTLLYEYDQELLKKQKEDMDARGIHERWGEKIVSFGERFKGKPYKEVLLDANYSTWLLEKAKFRTKAMEDLCAYLTVAKRHAAVMEAHAAAGAAPSSEAPAAPPEPSAEAEWAHVELPLDSPQREARTRRRIRQQSAAPEDSVSSTDA